MPRHVKVMHNHYSTLSTASLRRIDKTCKRPVRLLVVTLILQYDYVRVVVVLERGHSAQCTLHITHYRIPEEKHTYRVDKTVPAPPPLSLIRTTDHTMPRRKQEAKEEDEEYDESDESVANEKEEAEESNDEAPVPDAPPSGSKRKKKRRRINYEAAVIDLLPSHERKTEAGGYAHTNKSKEKISNANRGNTPWNKGKQRSSSDKAKIKAGVQARNRAIKLEKLRVSAD
jgi:hypothetical protein